MKNFVGAAVIGAGMVGLFMAAMSTTRSPIMASRRDTSDPHWREGMWETGGRRGPWRRLSSLGAGGAPGHHARQWFGSEHDPARDAHCRRYPELCQ